MSDFRALKVGVAILGSINDRDQLPAIGKDFVQSLFAGNVLE